jgi:hypothetical protein
VARPRWRWCTACSEFEASPPSPPVKLKELFNLKDFTLHQTSKYKRPNQNDKTIRHFLFEIENLIFEKEIVNFKVILLFTFT